MKTKLTSCIFVMIFSLAVLIFSGCKKDDVNNGDGNGTPNGNEVIYGAVTDIEGNEYKTVIIGNQEWMAENLRVSKLRDGSAISTGLSDTEWIFAENAAYSVYPFGLIDGLDSQDEVIQAYGLLYNGYALEKENLCPSGWFVPTRSEWTVLKDLLGGGNVAGGKLKETGTLHWNEPNVGATDEVGFTARPGGFRSGSGNFMRAGETAHWWTSTYSDRENFSAYAIGLGNTTAFFSDDVDLPFSFGFSVRCFRPVNVELSLPTINTAKVSDITPTSVITGGNVTRDGGGSVTAKGMVWGFESNPDIANNNGIFTAGSGLGFFTHQITELEPGTTYFLRAFATNSAGTSYGDEIEFRTYESAAVADVDGNYYNIVTIGNQKWFAENLKVRHYNNGDPIIANLDDLSWQNATSGSYAVYPRDLTYGITSEKEMLTAYGALYNWFAVADERGLCPEGFHVPSVEDWQTLYNYIASINNDNIGTRLKSSWHSDPQEPFTFGHPRWTYANDDLIGTDDFNFSALPSGNRDYSGSYSNIGAYAWWWTSTGNSHAQEASNVYMIYNSGDLFLNGSYPKQIGFSVRCFKNGS